MFILEPKFTYSAQSKTLSDHSKMFRKILKQILPKDQKFADKQEFLSWAKSQLPILKWDDSKIELPNSLSLVLLAPSFSEFRLENLFVEMAQKWLLPTEEASLLSFQYMDFHFKGLSEKSFLIIEVKLLVKNSWEVHHVFSNLPTIAKHLTLAAKYPLHASYIQTKKTVPVNFKASAIHEKIQRVIHKYPNQISRLLVDEMDHFLELVSSNFLSQRSSDHLSTLICLIYWLKKKILEATTFFADTRYTEVRLVQGLLKYPFTTKKVLGCLVCINLAEKHESFDEEHLMLAIKKNIPSARSIQESLFTSHPNGQKIKTLYLEIEKADSLDFTAEEKRNLKKSLEETLKFSIEKKLPSIFMVRNEEEVLRSILTLSQELTSLDKIPQVMIKLDPRSTNEIVFTVILVAIRKEPSVPLRHLFEKASGDFRFTSERIQTVGYLNDTHPIEAQVFSLHLPKDAAFLRADTSVNFYLARLHVTKLMTSLLGSFRDYNGGAILRQNEVLSHFRESFTTITPDLVENFFYAICPIEKQTSISTGLLNHLFEIYLNGSKTDFSHRQSYFFKHEKIGNETFLSLQGRQTSLKEIQPILEKTLIVLFQELVHVTLSVKGILSFNYVLKSEDPNEHVKFTNIVTDIFNAWHRKLSKNQVLQVSFEFPVISLDPRIGGDAFSGNVINLLFEGLMRVNVNGELEYGMAQSVKKDSELKKYTFSIRRAFWNNNTRVRAQDFEYAWKRVLSPEFKTPFSYLFYPIKNAKKAKEGVVSIDEVGVKALDDDTLEVNLEFPAPYFLELTAHTLYSPVHQKNDTLCPHWPSETLQGYVCNGPFELKTNTPMQGYELNKNALYWDYQKIKLDQILISRRTPYEAFQMFGRGEIDWIGNPFCSWNPNFKAQKNDKTVSFSNHGCYWYVFNTTRFPFHNAKLRCAFNTALDRLAICAQMPLDVQPAHSPLSQRHSQKKQPTRNTFASNDKKALELFEEALEELGLTRDSFPTFTLIHLKGGFRDDAANLIKDQWEKCFNIRCQIEPLEWNILFSKMTQGDFQIGGILWNALINDPIYSLNAFKHAQEATNFSKWENLKYQKLLNLSDKEIDPIKRLKYLQKAEEIILKQVPVMPIFYHKFKALVKDHVQDVRLNSLSVLDLKWASIKAAK